MVTVTLDDRDTVVLERLRQGDADIESLAERASCDPEYLQNRLPELADNGLVQRVDDSDDVYRLTDNGERVLVGSPAGTMDDRIDTPPAVEERIESFDLRPDRADAVRGAFAFLYYWGEASESEIVDGVYSEHPAAFESEREWWDELVRERLAELPSVEPPGAGDRQWRYDGTPVVEKHTADGRAAPDDPAPDESSARFALERLDDDERAAVRAAFDHLAHEGESTATAVEDQVYPDHDAGYESASEWWADCVRPAFERLPGVERSESDRDVWQYHQSGDGPMSSAPGAEVPEELLEPRDDEE